MTTPIGVRTAPDSSAPDPSAPGSISPTETLASRISVTARFFAAAEEAVGAAELTLELPAHSTIREALAAAGDHEAQRILARCSFLLNTEATADAATELNSGDQLDVLPPFAGG